MMDKDLAVLYGVPTKVLLQSVKRNYNRFPEDFMFQVTKEEILRCQIGTSRSAGLRSQFVTSSWGGRRYLPYAFTEQGVAMLSSVLNSERAVQVNIQIMRAFVNLRREAFNLIGLKRKVEAIEKRYDAQFKVVFEAIKRLLTPEREEKKKRIGFHTH